MSLQNIVAAVFFVVLATGVYLAINLYEAPAATIQHVDLNTDDLELLVRVHGNCPTGCATYTVHILGSGQLRFVGEELTYVTGRIDGHIDEGKLFLIGSTIQHSGYLEWSEVDECTGRITHQPTVLFWVKWHSQERKEERSLGCISDQTDALRTLLATVNQAANTDEWIGRSHRGPAISSVIRTD